MKDKCYAARRDQSYQLSLLKQKELTISQLCEYFQDSILSSSIKAPVLRHYSQLFVLRTINSICLDQYVLFNPNSICIIGLAPSHSIIRNHHRCCSIQWGVSLWTWCYSRQPGNTRLSVGIWYQESLKREAFGWTKMMWYAYWKMRIESHILL